MYNPPPSNKLMMNIEETLKWTQKPKNGRLIEKNSKVTDICKHKNCKQKKKTKTKLTLDDFLHTKNLKLILQLSIINQEQLLVPASSNH